jgi:hypothetical protein
MKFRNKETGVILEPRSTVVEDQLRNSPAYEEYQEKAVSEEKPLEKMNKAELLALAAQIGVQTTEKATNAEIIALIKAARGE